MDERMTEPNHDPSYYDATRGVFVHAQCQFCRTPIAEAHGLPPNMFPDDPHIVGTICSMECYYRQEETAVSDTTTQ